MTDRQQRTERAMGEAMYQMAVSMPDDKGMDDYVPFSFMMEQEDRRSKQLNGLSK